MVFHSSSGPAASRATGSASQQDAHQHTAGVIQAPLKRKRSLSKFYFAKSQSFNCMSDLLKNSAFSKSSLLLAKRSSSSSSSGGYAQSFPSISEDMSECTSPRGLCPEASTAAIAAALAAAAAAPSLQPSPFAASRRSSLERRSWDASDCSTPEPCCGMGCYSLPAALDHNCCSHAQEQMPQQQQLGVVSSLTSRSGSSSLELAAADDDACCWAEGERSATDSLCMALQTTSLAAAAAAPQGLMPVGGGSYHGCYMVEV